MGAPGGACDGAVARMKERPIPFSAQMVRAILAGRKTQTRRVVDPQPEQPKHEHPDYWLWRHRALDAGYCHTRTEAMTRLMLPLCPYGQPGDRLWVREAFRLPASLDDLSPNGVAERCLYVGYSAPWCPTQYEADQARISPQGWREFGSRPNTAVPGRYRHARFMPRWAARTLLEITGVRVERVQNMQGQSPYPGESDALAEGINRIHHGDGAYYYSAFRDEPHPKNWCDPTDAFRELWDSINAKRGFGWDANSWVWVIEFRTVEAAHG